MADAAPAVPSIVEGTALLARYARGCARLDAIEAELETELAPLKAAADRKRAPLLAELDALKQQLEPWWAARSAELTKGKKKSAELGGCVIGTRAGAKRLAFAHGDDDDAALALYKDRRFWKLLKRVISLDKKAIVARVEAEPTGAVADLGFSVEQDETFFVGLAVRAGRKA